MNETIKAECQHERTFMNGSHFYFDTHGARGFFAVGGPNSLAKPIGFCPDCGTQLEPPKPKGLAEVLQELEKVQGWDTTQVTYFTVGDFRRWAKVIKANLEPKVELTGEEYGALDYLVRSMRMRELKAQDIRIYPQSAFGDAMESLLSRSTVKGKE